MSRSTTGKGIESTLAVHIHPKASRTCFLETTNDVVHIKLRAAPVEGKANEALIEFLSRSLGVRKRDISIERGEKSKDKLIAITGMTREKALEIIGTAINDSRE